MNRESDISNEWIKGSSPFIHSMNYDVEARELRIFLLETPEDTRPSVEICITKVTSYNESDVEVDDECRDSIIGAHWAGSGTLIIRTEKREIVLGVSGEVKVEQCA